MKVSALLKKKAPSLNSGMPTRHPGQTATIGEKACFSPILQFEDRAQADREFPKGLPEYVQLRWATFHPKQGWKVVFEWWQNQGDGRCPLPVFLTLARC